MNNINFGNWQETEKLTGSNTWQDPHHSGIADLGRKLDVMTYVPGLNALPNTVHDIAIPVASAVNQYASPVVGVAQEINRYANPWIKTIKKSAPGAYDYINGIEEYAHQKPGDAAAVAAATYFTAGAATEAVAGAGAAAAPAASGGAEAVGGLGAGAEAGIGAAAGNAITPTFASGAVDAGMAGASAGTGTLGAAGTAAGAGMLTPSFGAGGASSFMNSIRPIMDKVKTVNSYKNSLSSQTTPNNDRINANNQADNLTRSILNSGNAPSTTGRITNQIVMNRFGMR